MAMMSDTTNRPQPEIRHHPLTDLEHLTGEIRKEVSALYFGLLGLEVFTRDSTPNPGSLDGMVRHACAAWSNAIEAERLTEALVAAAPAGDSPTDRSEEDEIAHELWRKWYDAAAEACRQGIGRAAMLDTPESRADPAHAAALAEADAVLDRLYDARDGMETALHGLTGIGPVAMAARLHSVLRRTGGGPDDEEDTAQGLIRCILADLLPKLPRDMQAALADPYSELPEGGDR